MIGSIVLPYLEGNEVWGIARIYDSDAAELMLQTHTSTSPGVSFLDGDVGRYVRTENGDKMLIEAEPALLDHLAVCDEGVWDKMAGPSGVRID